MAKLRRPTQSYTDTRLENGFANCTQAPRPNRWGALLLPPNTLAYPADSAAALRLPVHDGHGRFASTPLPDLLAVIGGCC